MTNVVFRSPRCDEKRVHVDRFGQYVGKIFDAQFPSDAATRKERCQRRSWDEIFAVQHKVPHDDFDTLLLSWKIVQ